MRLVITLEHRFERTPDGAIWTQTQFAYPFWTRYLSVFDMVRVVARVRDVRSVPADWQQANGPRVAFAAVPYYVGPWQYVQQSRRVGSTVRGAVGSADAVILRVGSRLASCLEPLLHRADRPYGVEVVGDPHDVYAPGAARHPLRPFFRWWFTRELQRQCARACAAAYVTQHALQRRYPPSPEADSTYYSDVELPDGAFVEGPRRPRRPRSPFTLITVGTLAQLYKAPDVLIDAVGLGVRGGLDLRLRLIGDGRHRSELEARAAAAGLGGRVDFVGQVSAGAAVRAQLDRADLFVLPSRQEGLPRAMVEAMARGLPCLGSTVGGMPELLPAEDLVPPGDASALAARIAAVAADPERQERMSARNLAQARDYRDEVLQQRRVTFYRQVRSRTETWLQACAN